MSPKLPLAPPPPLPKLPHCWPAVPRPSAISMSPRGPAPAALPSAAPSQRRTHLPAPIANPSCELSTPFTTSRTAPPPAIPLSVPNLTNGDSSLSDNMSLQGRAPSAACRSMTLLQLLVSISISDAWI
ncbi:early nodulin-20-like isoform X1 [Sorghum bicolor]|uniref:Uncharacterized protein n=2 Tax=Sorghum bicolor TaxID=4558 RepID=A0A1Z5RCN7_SORBI|nr:early nodulin-20-like isoform X1 [Sorghum bicolor]OQU81349.1 hypothetical protein SORBI_3006G045700 [Sorghum bicolor]|eukprot:XP_021318206.1 early nodulin-20-like isoform X1 [Sorghum bicolor]